MLKYTIQVIVNRLEPRLFRSTMINVLTDMRKHSAIYPLGKQAIDVVQNLLSMILRVVQRRSEFQVVAEKLLEDSLPWAIECLPILALGFPTISKLKRETPFTIYGLVSVCCFRLNSRLKTGEKTSCKEFLKVSFQTGKENFLGSRGTPKIPDGINFQKSCDLFHFQPRFPNFSCKC